MKALKLTHPWRVLAGGLLFGSAIALAGMRAGSAEADENLPSVAVPVPSVLDKEPVDEALAYKLMLHSGLHAAQPLVVAEQRP